MDNFTATLRREVGALVTDAAAVGRLAEAAHAGRLDNYDGGDPAVYLTRPAEARRAERLQEAAAALDESARRLAAVRSILQEAAA